MALPIWKTFRIASPPQHTTNVSAASRQKLQGAATLYKRKDKNTMCTPQPNVLRWTTQAHLHHIEHELAGFMADLFQPTPDLVCHIVIREIATIIPHDVELHCIRDQGDWMVYADAMLVAVVYTDCGDQMAGICENCGCDAAAHFAATPNIGVVTECSCSECGCTDLKQHSPVELWWPDATDQVMFLRNT